MGIMRKTVIFLLAVFVPLLLFLAALFISLGQLEQPAPAVQAGRLIWQERGCMECHTIFGNGGYNAREITEVYSERGSEWISSFLDQPPMLTKTFRHPTVSGDQRGWLLEFLSYLDTVRMRDWPPRPDTAKPAILGREP